MDRDLFTAHALHVAPRVLGARLRVDSKDGPVALRITEVEAYHGVGVPGPYDAGSHSRDRKTERNASMFGPPGHAYVYFTYGMHYALNLVCSPEGTASAVLIRAGEIVEGVELAEERRRSTRRSDAPELPGRMLARGPGNVAAALGIVRKSHDGLDPFDLPFAIDPAPHPPTKIATGPRVGVAGAAGSPEFPWRFWITGDPTVSAFRPGRGAPAWRPPR
ncbi:MAG: DNA-3-methyladenine glycosylase [Tessaracoccus sp.]